MRVVYVLWNVVMDPYVLLVLLLLEVFLGGVAVCFFDFVCIMNLFLI